MKTKLPYILLFLVIAGLLIAWQLNKDDYIPKSLLKEMEEKHEATLDSLSSENTLIVNERDSLRGARQEVRAARRSYYYEWQQALGVISEQRSLIDNLQYKEYDIEYLDSLKDNVEFVK